ncbi:MAG TPA: hypothetical protein PK156_20060 [Polyangium sp.]|nr:hypothetical protein [Polyangium sp.]
MTEVSFAHVPAEGFTAFGVQLANDAWSTIDVSAYLGANGRLLQSLGGAPAFVLFKAQLLLAVTEVVHVVQSTAGAKTCDEAWDRAQKRFSGLIAVGRMSLNDREKSAADRLHAALLLGKSGEGQTRLAYQHEVDFGRKQIRLSAETQCAADIALLGLGTVMASIASTTEELAAAIGQGRPDLAPAKQRRAAVANCIQVFGTVYRAIEWIAEHGDRADQEMAVNLLGSFNDLVARYPARDAKPKAILKPAPITAAAVT